MIEVIQIPLIYEALFKLHSSLLSSEDITGFIHYIYIVHKLFIYVKFVWIVEIELTFGFETFFITKKKKSDYTDNIAVSRKCIEDVTK